MVMVICFWRLTNQSSIPSLIFPDFGKEINAVAVGNEVL